MSGDLGEKQKWLLALAFRHEQRHDGAPAPITRLSEAFFSYSNRIDTDAYVWREAALAKRELFQTRRAIRALIKRGLMEEAGTAVVRSGMGAGTGGGDQGPGRYYLKRYTRVCKTYRLTDAGREIGKAEDEAVHANVLAMDEANPELKEIAGRATQHWRRWETDRLNGAPPAAASAAERQ